MTVACVVTHRPEGGDALDGGVPGAPVGGKLGATCSVSRADSKIASSLLKVAEIYPDSSGGSDQITYTYNRQQQVLVVTDQGGTEHTYAYDALGRVTQDRATASRVRCAYRNRSTMVRTAYPTCWGAWCSNAAPRRTCCTRWPT